jgi:hypothetical protein
MASSGMLRRVYLVRSNVSKEFSVPIVRETRWKLQPVTYLLRGDQRALTGASCHLLHLQSLPSFRIRGTGPRSALALLCEGACAHARMSEAWSGLSPVLTRFICRAQSFRMFMGMHLALDSRSRMNYIIARILLCVTAALKPGRSILYGTK